MESSWHGTVQESRSSAAPNSSSRNLWKKYSVELWEKVKGIIIMVRVTSDETSNKGYQTKHGPTLYASSFQVFLVEYSTQSNSLKCEFG